MEQPIASHDIDSDIDGVLSTGSTVIGIWQDTIADIASLAQQSTGGFGGCLLFNHSWAPAAAKKHHYELFGDFVLPYFRGTSPRMQKSEGRG